MSRSMGVIGMFNEAGKFYSVPNLPYAYMHWKCGGPAFMSDYLPLNGTPIDVSSWFHLDGSKVVDGEQATCDTCGEPLWDMTCGPKAEDFRKVNGGMT